MVNIISNFVFPDYISLKSDQIKILISNRNILETVLYESSFKEIIESLYIDLDTLIEKVTLTNRQKDVLDKRMLGYSEKDIANMSQCQPSVINKIINKICFRLEEVNDSEWMDWTEINGIVKIDEDSKYKKCRKCGEFLKVNKENFSPNSRAKDGYLNICRGCRKK